MIHAHYTAILPNFQIMEFDVDEAPWLHEFFGAIAYENGELVLTDKPGWGMDVVERGSARPPELAGLNS